MSDNKAVFRFAPSPNGFLHLGHVLSALETQRLAKRFGGRLLLRLEDIDIGRCRPEFETQILDDLAWLGFAYELPVRRQSEHMAFYAEGIAKLDALGVLYPCFATRREIAEASDPSSCDPDGAPLYPGIWRQAAASDVETRQSRGEAFALRLDMVRACEIAADKVGADITFRSFDEIDEISAITADPAAWGDVVIARKDSPTSYHLSVVMDDALQSVTHVTRGRDLLASTSIHRLLQILLDLPEPLYHHHRLILDDDGRKLSKSDGDLSLKQLRASGASLAHIRELIGL